MPVAPLELDRVAAHGPNRERMDFLPYRHFRDWAISEGFQQNKLPAINGFTQRVLANAKGIEKGRNKQYGRHFVGLVLSRAIPQTPF